MTMRFVCRDPFANPSVIEEIDMPDDPKADAAMEGELSELRGMQTGKSLVGTLQRENHDLKAEINRITDEGVLRLMAERDALRDAARMQAISDSERITALRAEVTRLSEGMAQWRYDCDKAIAERDIAQREVDHFKNSGIIEVAIRNASVAEYMRHWEGRTERAEKDIRSLESDYEDLRRIIDGHSESMNHADAVKALKEKFP
jgi:chromosome segregation ATPase